LINITQGCHIQTGMNFENGNEANQRHPFNKFHHLWETGDMDGIWIWMNQEMTASNGNKNHNHNHNHNHHDTNANVDHNISKSKKSTKMELFINGGQLESNPEVLDREWGDYFCKLATGKTEHFRDSSNRMESSSLEGEKEEKEEKEENINEDPLLSSYENWPINAPLTWYECRNVINKMKNNKAPGLDGITIEWLKCATKELKEPKPRFGNMRKVLLRTCKVTPTSTAINDDHNDNNSNNEHVNRITPGNPMAKVIWFVLQSIWNSEVIPYEWEIARIVPILKKGDPRVMDNYRGISLISTMVKVIMTIVEKRLQKYVKRNNFIRKEQVGFRPREECIAQARTLYHILYNRKYRMKEQTFLCFIDFRKAYDRVPHWALLKKLKSDMKLGNSKIMRLIKAAYRNPKLTVQNKVHPNSDAVFPLLCGVRQGCPSSPILFNMFINDLFDGMEQYGVQVPGLKKSSRIPGLLFADDAVLLASDRESMKSMLKLTDNWCQRWEMEVNTNKCGIMITSPAEPSSQIQTLSSKDGEDDDGGESDNNATNDDIWHFSLNDKEPPIPIVKEYCYLGNIFSLNIDLTKMIDERVTKGRQKLMSIKHFLRNYKIPLLAKKMAIQSVLIPILTYGAELWGEDWSSSPSFLRSISSICQYHLNPNVQKIDQILNKAIQWTMKCGNSLTNAQAKALQRELNISSISKMVSYLIRRGRCKFPTLKTWIGDIHRKGEETISPSFAKRTRYNRLFFTCDCNRGHFNRLSSYPIPTNRTIRVNWVYATMKYPNLQEGIECLIRLRASVFKLAPCLAETGILPSKYHYDSCPCCNNNRGDGPETIVHLILFCTRWSIPRQASRITSMDLDVIKLLFPDDNEEDEEDEDENEEEDKCPLQSNDDYNNTICLEHNNESLWFRFATFFQAISRERRLIISSLSLSRRRLHQDEPLPLLLPPPPLSSLPSLPPSSSSSLSRKERSKRKRKQRPLPIFFDNTTISGNLERFPFSSHYLSFPPPPPPPPPQSPLPLSLGKKKKRKRKKKKRGQSGNNVPPPPPPPPPQSPLPLSLSLGKKKKKKRKRKKKKRGQSGNNVPQSPLPTFIPPLGT
jgi:hypothetical protein